MLFGAVKIMLCINLPISIGMTVLPKIGDMFVNEMLKFPSQMGFIQVACLNILISAMVFDVFFFWEGVRAGLRTWFPKMIKNLIIAAGAFLLSVVLIYVTWDKSVIGFDFLVPKIGLEEAFWLAVPIRVVIAIYKLIVGVLASVKNGNDQEFEENGGEKHKYQRHPSHTPPQIRRGEPRHQ